MEKSVITAIGKYSMYEELKFRYPKNSIIILRNIDIALKVANGINIKDLSTEYKCSKTTIINAYKKVCRYIYNSTRNDEKYTELNTNFENAYLYGLRFSDPKIFIPIIEFYKNYVTKKINEDKKVQWDKLPNEVQSLHATLTTRFNNLLINAEKKRNAHIRFANHEYEVFKNSLDNIMNEFNLLLTLDVLS